MMRAALVLCLALASTVAGEYCLSWTLYEQDFEPISLGPKVFADLSEWSSSYSNSIGGDWDPTPWSMCEPWANANYPCPDSTQWTDYNDEYGRHGFGPIVTRDGPNRPKDQTHTVTLSLEKIPLHSTLTFEANIIFSGGCESCGQDPSGWWTRDEFAITVDGTTISEWNGWNSTMQESFGGGTVQRLVWNEDLKLPWVNVSDPAVNGLARDKDDIYRAKVNFEHTGETSQITVGFTSNTNGNDKHKEAWGIDGVKVTLEHCFEPTPVCNLEEECAGGQCNAAQSTFEQYGSWTVDEIFDDSTTTCMKTAVAVEDEQAQYLMVDLEEYRLVGTVRFVSAGAEEDFMVKVSRDAAGQGKTYNLNGELVDAQNPTFGGQLPDEEKMEVCAVKAMGGGVFEASCPPATKGQYVYVIRAAAKTALEVCDFEVFSLECKELNEEVGCPMGYEPASCTSRCSGCVPCQPGFYSDKEGPYTCTPCPGASLKDISDGLVPGSYSPPGSTSVFQCEGDLYVDGTSTLDVVPGGVVFDQSIDAWHIDVMYSQAWHIQVNGVSALYMSDGGEDFEDDIYTAAKFPCRADNSASTGDDLSVSLEETMCCLQDMRQDYLMTKIFRDWTGGLDLVAANDVCDAADGSDLLINADLSVVGEGTEFVGVDGSSFANKITIEPIEGKCPTCPDWEELGEDEPNPAEEAIIMKLILCESEEGTLLDDLNPFETCVSGVDVFETNCCNAALSCVCQWFLQEEGIEEEGPTEDPTGDRRSKVSELRNKLNSLRKTTRTKRRLGYYTGMQYARITIPDAELFKISRHSPTHVELPVDDETTSLTDQRELFIGLLDMLPTGTRVVDSASQQISIKLTRTQYGTFSAYGEQNIDYDFISYLNARAHKVFSQKDDEDDQYYLEITYVYDDRLMLNSESNKPVEDLTTVTIDGEAACNTPPGDFTAVVGQTCGPSTLDFGPGPGASNCPQVSLPDDKFGRLYIPLPEMPEDDVLSVSFSLSFIDGTNQTASLPVSVDIVVSDFVSWCDEDSGSVDLAERVIPAITIGTESENPPRLYGFDRDTPDFSTGAETLQDGLITLELSLNETNDLDDNLEVFMEDVLVIQINPGSPTVTIADFMDGNDGTYIPTYTYDPDTRDAKLHIPEGLKTMCPEATFSESFFGCVHKHVLEEEEVTNPEWSYLVGSSGDVASTGAQDFMETMLGSGTASVAARELGRDYEEYLLEEEDFATRKKVGLWINPGHVWGQTVHNAEYSLSEHVVIYVLFGVRSGVDGTERRMLLQATKDGRGGVLQTVSYDVSASELVEEVLGDEAVVTEVRAELSLSSSDACKPQAELLAWCASTLESAVAPHSSAIKAVQCISVEVKNANCGNARRASGSPTAVVDAVIALEASEDAKLDMEAVVASGAVLSLQRTGGEVIAGAITNPNVPGGPDATPAQAAEEGSSTNGAIIGAAAGAAAGVVLLGLGAWWFMKRRGEQTPSTPVRAAGVVSADVENQKARLEAVMFNDDAGVVARH